MEGGRPEPSALLERDREEELLSDVFDAAAKGVGAVVVIEGPAGIGKSGLLALARQRAAERGMAVGRTSGFSLEQDFPYGGVRRLLGPLIGTLPDPDSTFSGVAGAARSVVGAVLEPPPDDNPGSVLNGLFWLTAELAERSPLLLACDDAHWLDLPTLRYIAYLANRIADLSVALVIGTRPPEAGAEGELLTRIISEHRDEVVRLRPLSTGAVSAIVHRDLDAEADAEFCLGIAEASGGNPFLVTELVRSARAAGVLAGDDGARRLAELSAGSIVSERLSRLSAPAIEVARAVAVLTGDAQLRHVAALSGLPPAETSAVADELIRAEILTADRPLGFVHPLVGAAVYNQLLPGDRSSRHRAAARLLAAEGISGGKVASHLLATDGEADPWTVDVLVEAARAAVARGATDAAITFFRRALEEPPDPAQRVGILLELGTAEMLVTDPGAVEHLASAVEALGDVPEVRVPLTIAHGVALAIEGDYATALREFDDLDVALADDPALALEAVGGGAIVGLTGPAGAGLAGPRIRRLLDEVSPVDAMSPLVRGVRSFTGALANEPAAVMADLASSALAAEPVDDPARWMWLHFPLTVLVMADRVDEATVRIDEGIGLARRLGAPVHTGVTLTVRGWLALRTGDLADAEADASAAIEALQLHGLDFVLAGPLGILVDVAVERGDLDEAERLLERWGYTTEPGRSFLSLFLLRGRGLLRLAQGRVAEAVADLELGRRRLAAASGVNPAFQAWGAHLGRALALDPETRPRALDEARHELERAQAFGAARAIGVCRLARAEVEGGEDVEMLQAAVEDFRLAGDRLNEARASVALGRARRSRGDRHGAVGVLAAALDLADRCGATALAASAREELVATGARPRRNRVTGVESLTPSERRVAGLAAAGRTNRAIAEELFLSAKTVESHLAHTYQKLGIGGRAGLAAALAAGA